MTDDLAGYRRILAMVQILHQRGYQRLRICPRMSPSGIHWRCSITPVTNTRQDHGARLRSWDVLAAHYTTGQGLKFFDWEDAEGLSIEALADRFLAHFPAIAAAGYGPDWTYAGWYQDMLRLTHPDAFPIAYSDYFGEDPAGLPCVGGAVANDLRVPLPPPGLAPPKPAET